MKDTCLHCRTELSASPPAGAHSPGVAAHLATCPDCRRWMERDAATWQALGAIREPETPAGLAGRIFEHTRPRPAFRLRRLVLGMAGAVALAAGIVYGAWLGNALSTSAPPATHLGPPEVAYAELFDATPIGGLEHPAMGPDGRRP